MNSSTRSSYNKGYINIKKIISDSNRIINSSFGDNTIDQYKINIEMPDIDSEKEKEQTINENTTKKVNDKKEQYYYQYY